MAGRRAGDLHRRVGIDAAGVFRSGTTRHLPFSRRTSSTAPPWAAISISTSSLVILAKFCALRLLLDADAGEHQFFVGVFEIRHEQAVLRRVGGARHRQIAEEVVVVAELQFLRGRALLQRVERRRARQHRIAPADQDVGIAALGDVMLLVDTGGDFLEREAAIPLRLRTAGSGDGERAHGRGDGGHAERALEQIAAVEAGGDDVADGGVVARVAPNILRRFEGLSARLGKMVHARGSGFWD